MQDRFIRSLPDLIVLAAYCLAQMAGAHWLLRGRGREWSPWARRGVVLFAGLLLLFGGAEFPLRFERFLGYAPGWLSSWGRSFVMGWALLSFAWTAEIFTFHLLRRWRRERVVSPARRQFLQATKAALMVAPAAALGWGIFIERKQFVIREQRLLFPDLPQDLDGLRIVQLTDIHMGAFLDRADVTRVVAMANETKANLALVTGDLITTRFDPLMTCLDELKNLRSDAGTYGCLGNHEIYARAEGITEREGLRRGLRFLRRSAVPLKFGGATLNLAGVDYQRFGLPYLVGAEDLVLPGAFNVMLSHNPDTFPVAAKKGFPLSFGGHTHGGQVRVEILSADMNVARFFTRYVDGLYQEGSSLIYVSRGIGTIGLPARLGAPPEVSLLTLCRS